MSSITDTTSLTNSFVTKLNPAGTAVVYSTYLGGNETDKSNAIAVDAASNAYITGWTGSLNFPVVGPAQGSIKSISDGFVTKLNGGGSAIVYSTYLGGTRDDIGNAIAVDGAGSAYVAGQTASLNFPTTTGAYDTACGTEGTCNQTSGGGYSSDAFATKLTPAGNAFAYSTYIGGTSVDIANGIALRADGHAYVTGVTSSSDFPTVSPVQATKGSAGSGQDAFALRLNETGQITACGNDAQCIHDRRVGVADAFFFEAEFQQTGAYIYRIYKAAIGIKPTYAQFINDRGRVVSGPGLDQSKSDYALYFVKSAAFQQEYATATTADQFVDRMLTVVKNYSGVDLSSQRNSLIALYDGTDNGKAAILRQVADNQALIDAEYNQSFVLMEYFGYLRRDPDQGGYDFWLGQVNKYPLRNVAIQHAMACSFITSAEYQTRFSSVVTHTNRECPQ